MTIDEAIEQERKQAEMYRCEYECECNYYCKGFVDDHADEFECIKNMHEHEQLAEWLEELKAYRQYIDLTEIPEQYKLGFQDGIIEGNNKAIDDFVKFANTMPTVEEDDGEIRPMRLEEMAEKLKAGGSK